MSDYTSWYVGMKVVCVDASSNNYAPWTAIDPSMDGLQEGVVYTIRKLGLYSGQPCVWLTEIERRMRVGHEALGECGYSPRRFRKVQPRKTSIAIFHSILNGHRISEDA